MLDVARILDGLPTFDRFLTAEKVAALVGQLSLTSHGRVEVAVISRSRLPIHHVPAGEGSIAAADEVLIKAPDLGSIHHIVDAVIGHREHDAVAQCKRGGNS